MNNYTTIVKVGTGVVSNADRTKLDRRTIRDIGADISALEGRESNKETIRRKDSRRLKQGGSIILVSSGAITAGIERLRLSRDEVMKSVRMQQTAAMVGNTVLFKLWEDATGIVVGHDLLTHNDLSDQEHWDNLSGVIANNLNWGVLNVFNEADARSNEELQRVIEMMGHEHKRFGDNDQLAAHLAVNTHRFLSKNEYVQQYTQAIFLTDTNGVYEDVSRADSKIDTIRQDDIDEVILRCVSTDDIEGNGGMLSKLLAAKELTAAGIDVSIGAGKTRHALMHLHDYTDGFGTQILANDGFAKHLY